MNAHFEKVTSGQASLLAFERVDRSFPFHWHYHPEFEISMIVDSSGQRVVGNGIAEYGPGDVILLGSNLPHGWRSTPGTPARELHRAIVVQFREDFLGDKFLSLEEMRPVRTLLDRAAAGLSFGHLPSGRSVAPKLARFPLLSDAQRLVSLLDILLELSSESEPDYLSTDLLRPVCRVEEQHRIDKICRHLIQHYEQDIDFTVLAKLIHMEQASLCRFFKRATGRTMTTYVNELRVGAATQMLLHTDQSVIDIGFSVGFGNYSNFNRQFKRIRGIGPREVRRNFRTGLMPVATG